MPSHLAMPPAIAAVYLDFDWERERVWALDLEEQRIDRQVLDWHLELPFWSTRPPAPLFDLVPRRVLDDPTVHEGHARRIDAADMRFALDVIAHRGRLCIMDGIHRLARATRDGQCQVSVRRVPRAALAAVSS